MQSPKDIEAAYQTFLSHVYRDVSAKGLTSTQLQFYEQSHICPTFGELLTPSIMHILSHLKLSNHDVFLDLGSGMGKLALTVYLRTRLKHVIGVEGSQLYHAQAVQILEDLRADLTGLFSKGKLELILGNFLDFDFNQATIIYTCSTCFTQELLWLIGDKINRADNVQQVLSLRPIANLERLPLKDILHVECSWDSALCYYYAKE